MSTKFTDDGFLVYKGAKFRLELTKTAGKWVSNARNRLFDSGIIKESNGNYLFQSDYLFNSPSGAAAVVLAR